MSRAILRKVVATVVVFLFSTPLFGQSPQTLLRRTAENYQNLDSFEFHGTMTADIPGSSWALRGETVDAGARAKFVPAGSPWPALPGITDILNIKPVNLRGDQSPFPDNVAADFLPPLTWQHDQIDHRVRSIRRVGSESLLVNGEKIPCMILEVEYTMASRNAKGAEIRTVRYWISPAMRLVFRETFSKTDSNNRVHNWDYRVDSFRLNQPPPREVLDRAEKQIGKVRPEWVGRPAPDFVLSDLGGHKVSSHDLRGKAFLLDFWGTYCGPCKEEMPMIARLRSEYGGNSLEVWGITDDSTATAKKWMKKSKIALPILIDQKRNTFDQFQVDSIPVLVLIGKDGKVADYRLGMQYEKDVRAAIEKALGQ